MLRDFLLSLISRAGRAVLPVLCLIVLAGGAARAQTADSTDVQSTVADSSAAVPDTSQQGTMAVLPYNREQEQNYRQALRLHLPPSARFRAEARLLSDEWHLYSELRRSSATMAMRNNLDIPAELYIPTERERFLHEYNIAMSRYIPNLGPPRSAASSGLNISLSSIGQFLGLVEDVSPTISYAVEYTAAVEAVVYSTQARVVAVMFRGMQQPGRYSLTWNGRDEQGKPLPAGDYIAEVRIGKETIVRKRMQIP